MVEFDRPLILDACCVINVHACGRMGDVLRSLPVQAFVTITVRKQELQQTEALDALNPEGHRLGDLIESGTLGVVDFATDDEAGVFLDFAAAIGDDGEASSLAVGSARGYAVATDDRKARRFAGEEVPSVPLVYTLEVFEHWAVAAGVPASEVRAALAGVREHGRYVPSRTHPMYAWWNAFFTKHA